MKIAFIDLNHKTRGVHTNTVPLGSCLISRYLQMNVNHKFDIKIFKDMDLLFDCLNTWVPDVLSLAQYTWNSSLNMYAARKIKQLNPDCLVIVGGPDLEIDSKRREEYLRSTPIIDIAVAFDGEIPFTNIIKRKIAGETNMEIKATPEDGCYSLPDQSSRMVEALNLIPRLTSLDFFGAIYADGHMDELLDKGYHPFVQTHRGCPFSCQFCHTGEKYYTRMLFMSDELFRKDIEYLARRFSGQDNIVLYLANTNMGLFEQDFAIAEIIRDTQQKYSWPKNINVNSGKNPDKLLKMLSIIDFQPAIALQTTTKKVLENIKRINIPFDQYVSFQREVLKLTGESSATELILSLPGETKETFLDTMRKVMNSGVQNIAVYTLMNLKGTPLSSEKIMKEYGHVIKHRVVPRQFSKIGNEVILDTEEVVVATNTMSFRDYLELRKLCFTVTVFFSSIELVPLKCFLLEQNVDIAQWVFNIHDNICHYPELNALYLEFINETRNELFDTREDLEKFFNIPENYEALCDGVLGDNLLRKYKFIALSKSYSQILELSFKSLEKIIPNSTYAITCILDSLGKYLESRDLVKWVDGCTEQIELDYDIPAWLTCCDDSVSLHAFKGRHSYRVELLEEQQEKYESVSDIANNKELSLQMLYRDGSIKEFWPIWKCSE